MCGFSFKWRVNVEFAVKIFSLLQYVEIHFGVLPSGRTKLNASAVLIPNQQLVLFVYTRLAMRQQSVLTVAVT